MGVTVTKTSGGRAEITWNPQADDPQGHIAKLVETDRLAHILEAISGVTFEERQASETQALAAARSTWEAVRLLDRRSATQTVELHDQYKVGWKRIAEAVRGDAAAQSSIRKKYEQGLRGQPGSDS